MRIFFILLLCLTSSFSASLLTYNIYERNDRVDVMLSFDVPYEGKIYEKSSDNGKELTLVLEGVTYNESIRKDIASSIVQELLINPIGQSTDVTLKSNQKIALNASKTVDGFGLRIRVMTQNATTRVETNPSVTQLPQLQNESIVDFRYILVVGTLFILVILLYIIRNRVNSKLSISKESKRTGSWLFKNSQNNDSVKILHQKPLDQNNKIVLIEYNNKQYLIVSGGSNVLLDKFSKKDLSDEGEFNSVFEQNRQKLDEYLQIQQGSDNLGSYKQRVSRDYK